MKGKVMSETARFYIIHLAILALSLSLAYWCFGITNSAVDMLTKVSSGLGMVAGTIMAIAAVIVVGKEIVP